jgi:hypothetical protein
MFRSSYSTARRFCLALIVLAATGLLVPSGQPTAAGVSYPATVYSAQLYPANIDNSQAGSAAVENPAPVSWSSHR